MATVFETESRNYLGRELKYYAGIWSANRFRRFYMNHVTKSETGSKFVSP